MPLTIPQKISIGALCALYTSNENAAGGKVGGVVIDKRLPHLIYAVNQGLKWLYDLDPTNADLEIIGNYLISICRHQFRAQAVLALNNGGTIAPIVPNSSNLPNALDFIVSDSSFIATGETEKFIPQFIGFPIEFVRGGMTQYTTEQPANGSYYRWNIVTGLFQLLPNPLGAATEGEPFRIDPDTGGGVDSTGVSYPFIITGADFEVDGVTYDNPAIVGDQLMLFVTGYNQEWQFAGVFFNYTATGIEIIASGFDANDFGNIIVQKIN